MADKNSSKRHDDKSVIDLKEAWDINYWCDELNVRAEELREIVSKVGPSVHEVRLYLAKRLLINWPVAY